MHLIKLTKTLNLIIFSLALNFLFGIGIGADALFAGTSINATYLRPLAAEEKGQTPPPAQGPTNGLISEAEAQGILLSEQRYLASTFDAFEQKGIYKEHGLQKPQVPLFRFTAIEGDEKIMIGEREGRLILSFDINKIPSKEDLIGLYWVGASEWYFKHIADIYDKESEKPDFLLVDEGHENYLYTMNMLYIEQCGIREQDVVLDVGTSSGDMAILASRLTRNRVFGIDISPGVIDKAKQNAERGNASNVEFYVRNVLDLHTQFPSDSIDIVISNYTFTSMPPFLRVIALSEIYKVVKRRLNLWEYPHRADSLSRAWTEQEWGRYLTLVGFANITVTKICAEEKEEEVTAYFIQADKPQVPSASPLRPEPEPRNTQTSI